MHSQWSQWQSPLGPTATATTTVATTTATNYNHNTGSSNKFQIQKPQQNKNKKLKIFNKTPTQSINHDQTQPTIDGEIGGKSCGGR